MLNRRHSCLLVLCVSLGGAGCASKPVAIGDSIEDVYGRVHREGARDTVSLVREGLSTRPSYGSTDPVIPLRQPERVVPVWVPPYVDKDTGRRVDGHWQHTVIEDGEWALDY